MASACKKVLRKLFLQPDTMGLILTGRYTCNNKYSNKALMSLLHMEEIDKVKINTVATVASKICPNCPASM